MKSRRRRDVAAASEPARSGRSRAQLRDGSAAACRIGQHLDAGADQREAEDGEASARPGKIDGHHWPVTTFWKPMAIMLPHSGVGARTPAPTKLSRR